MGLPVQVPETLSLALTPAVREGVRDSVALGEPGSVGEGLAAGMALVLGGCEPDAVREGEAP